MRKYTITSDLDRMSVRAWTPMRALRKAILGAVDCDDEGQMDMCVIVDGEGLFAVRDQDETDCWDVCRDGASTPLLRLRKQGQRLARA